MSERAKAGLNVGIFIFFLNFCLINQFTFEVHVLECRKGPDRAYFRGILGFVL